MIKKLLSIAFFALTAHAASAQCTPNPAYANSEYGVWPDTTQNLPIACPNDTNGYFAQIDIKTLADTTLELNDSSIVANIRAFRINQVIGLPPGFVYQPNSSIWSNTGVNPPFIPTLGCIGIFGNRDSVEQVLNQNPAGQTYELNVIVDAQIQSVEGSGAVVSLLNLFLGESGEWLSVLDEQPFVPDELKPIEVTGYKIRILPASDALCASAGTAELIAPVSAKGNFPNPFNKNTNIQFNSDASKMVNLSVANMVGKVVYTSKIQANKGENTVNFTAEQLSPGVYFYTISDGKNSVTRRMVVAAN
jgi:hypothetical protein